MYTAAITSNAAKSKHTSHARLYTENQWVRVCNSNSQKEKMQSTRTQSRKHREREKTTQIK